MRLRVQSLLIGLISVGKKKHCNNNNNEYNGSNFLVNQNETRNKINGKF